MSDIIDRIDQLVETQLQQEPSGYDNNVNQDKCPHCNREWHGLKITQRIEHMRAFGVYDEDYKYTEDDSPVLCEGSEFIGPVRWPPSVDALADTVMNCVNGAMGAIAGIFMPDLPFEWTPLVNAPGASEELPVEGQRVSFATADGRLITGYVTHTETDGDTTTVTIQGLPDDADMRLLRRLTTWPNPLLPLSGDAS